MLLDNMQNWRFNGVIRPAAISCLVSYDAMIPIHGAMYIDWKAELAVFWNAIYCWKLSTCIFE